MACGMRPYVLFRWKVAAFAAPSEGGAQLVLTALPGVVLKGLASHGIDERTPGKLIEIGGKLGLMGRPVALDLCADLVKALHPLRVRAKLTLRAW
jgi:hypothetical protein